MLAALYYEPLWVFYRATETLTQLDELRYKRIAIGAPGSGGEAFAEPLLAANNVTGFNSKLLPLGGLDALGALQAARSTRCSCSAASARAAAIWQALHDKNLRLMSSRRADAYPRRFPWITPLYASRRGRRLRAAAPGARESG